MSTDSDNAWDNVQLTSLFYFTYVFYFLLLLVVGPPSLNKDINQSILLIPGMCGSLGEVEMAQAREFITYKALTKWTEENLNSQYKKEKDKFYNKNGR